MAFILQSAFNKISNVRITAR